MEGFSGLLEFVKPVKLSDIVLDVSETAEDFVVFRVHCKYDTQATGDEIVEKLKKLDKLNKRIEILKNEIEQIDQGLAGLPEDKQQETKLFLEGLVEGLLHALNIIES